jgi:hypothetical protein
MALLIKNLNLPDLMAAANMNGAATTTDFT